MELETVLFSDFQVEGCPFFFLFSSHSLYRAVVAVLCSTIRGAHGCFCALLDMGLIFFRVFG